jgi:very-short-patch-repair endonuclease
VVGGDERVPAHNVVVGQNVAEEKVRRAKELRRAMTPEEVLLWERLRNNRLNGLHFRRQQVIDGFIVDFYCHAAGLVVEVDGGVHLDRTDYDAERDRILQGRGLRVLRVPNSEVRESLSGVLKLIAAEARPAMTMESSPT